MPVQFTKVWQDIKWCKHLDKLHGHSIKVLWHLTMFVGYRNVIPGPVKLAMALGGNRSSISRAYVELGKADFVYRVGNVYKLSPLFCWKGNMKQYYQAIREYSDPRNRLLTMAASAVKGLI